MKVGVKSRFTSAGVLYLEKVEPITLSLMNCMRSARATPPRSASTVISASDCATMPRSRL